MDLFTGLYVCVILVSIDLASCSKNVLLIIADDFRPEISSYYNGHSNTSNIHPKLHTPNLDHLASRSILFKRAHVQQALCGPSRASFLTGRRPDTTKVYTLEDFFRNVGGNFTTLPQFFKLQGYNSVGMGKVFHRTPAGKYDDLSWSMPFFDGQKNHESMDSSWKSVPNSDLHNEPLIDQQIADHAIHTLTTLAPQARRGNKPFFMTVGFHKPHLPFVFPESFLQYYPENQIHLPANPNAPTNMPRIAWSSFQEIRSYKDVETLGGNGAINTTFPNANTRALRRAYYSATSYMDSLVGQVVDSVDTLGLSNNTIIAFIGDHGFQLGEHGEWCKHTNFELATNAPMMIKIPGRTDNGIKTNHVTEFVDLYPTLVEAAGFDALTVCPDDSEHVTLCTEGLSLLPFIDHPSTALKRGAFSQYPRNNGKVMGYSIRTYNYRYTEWVGYSDGPNWNDVIGKELYDHTIDPDENHNKADDPSYNQKIEILRKRLRGGWKAVVIPQIPAPAVG